MLLSKSDQLRRIMWELISDFRSVAFLFLTSWFFGCLAQYIAVGLYYIEHTHEPASISLYKSTNTNTISDQYTYDINRLPGNINWTVNSTRGDSLISKYNNLFLPDRLRPEVTLDRFSSPTYLYPNLECVLAYILGQALNASSTRGSESSDVFVGGITNITVYKSMEFSFEEISDEELIIYQKTSKYVDFSAPYTEHGDEYARLSLSRSGFYGAIVGIVAVVLVLFLAKCLYTGFCRNKKAEISLALPAQAPSVLEGITVEKAVEYSHEELSKATNDFSLDNKIGQGGFGSVYYADLRNEKAAIKKMDTRASKQFLAELRILTHVHHLNLVRLLGYCVEGSHFLVYEYIENGNLSQHLHGSVRDPLPWSIRVQIALDSARGLEYLHEYSVPVFVHCDIKSANILIDKNFNGKVADFGLTRLTEVGSRSRLAGTFGYMPPEYAQYGEVSPKVDVYAFGVVLYELISAKKAIIRPNGADGEPKGLIALFDEVFNQADPIDDLVKIVDPRLGVDYPLDSVHKVAQLAKACTHVDPQQRPNMRSIVVALMTLLSTAKD